MSQRYIGGLIYNPPGGFSGLFDGSGDYLSLAANTAFDLGSGDFTIEAWVNFNSFASSNGNVLISKGASGSVGGDFYSIQANSSGAILFFFTSGSPFLSGPTLTTGVWYHIAVTRSGTSFTMWVNGNSSATATSSATLSSGGPCIVGSQSFSPGASDRSLYGYLSNARIVKGTAVYTTAFTPPVGQLQAITNTSLLTCAYPTFRDGSSNNFTITVNGNTAVSTQNPFPQTQLPNPALGNQGNGVYTMSQYQALRSQNLWPAIDQYWPYVTLMLHGNGTNGAQNNTFLDSSTNNFTITRNGNTTQGTFTPYGANWSNYFDGSGDYLSIPSSAGLRFDGQFCVEGWVNFNAFNTQNFLISQFTAAGEAGWLVRYTGTALRLYAQNGAVTIDRTWSPSRGVWYHFAITRDSSNDIRFFIDGTQLGATATGVSTTMSSTNTAYIGGHPDIANDTNAYLSNMRVVKGSAVYTSNFTPSTAPLTAITNTSLLTCQSNRFIDNSSNNFTITRNGDVSVQRFSPFNPTTPYAAGTIGGSGYFDGSGDYLSAADNAAWDFGSGAFTIECWAYTETFASAYNVLVCQWNTTSAWIFRITSSLIGFYANIGGTQDYTASVTNTTGQWNHFAVTRSGTTLTFYKNGVSVGTATISGTINNATDALTIGILGDGNGTTAHKGYIAGMRIIKGTAQTTFDLTSPPTAITNTQLLLNFTNGGIIDNAMMNDLETVGNAQISTSVSKFGGGSMAFDGTDDRLTAPASPNLAFNTGDFTVEGWIYTGSTGNLGVFQISGTAGGLQANQTNNTAVYCNNLVLGAYYGGTFKTGTTPIVANTWTHFALVRSSSVTRLYVNGVLDSGFGSNSDTQNYTGQNICVGGYFGTSNLFNGNIDDFRVTRGYARYTANFTPQRSQWQDQ